jgi:hypothetical protein
MAKHRGKLKYKKITNPGGSVSWQVTGTRLDGTPVKRQFPTEADAKVFISDIYREETGIEEHITRLPTKLPPPVLRDAEAVHHVMPTDWTFKGMYEFCKANDYKPVLNSPKLEEVWEPFEKDKTHGDKRIKPITLDNYAQFIKPFLGHYPKVKLCNVSKRMVKSYITGGFPVRNHPNFNRPWNYGTQRTVAHSLTSLWEWGIDNEFMTHSPHWCPAEPDEYKKQIPPILTLEESQSLLDTFWSLSKSRWAAVVILETWQGIRPFEITESPLKQLNLTEGTFSVPDERKTGWRKVKLFPNVLIMLSVLLDRGVLVDGCLNPSRDTLRVFRGRAGWAVSKKKLLLRWGEEIANDPRNGRFGRWKQDLPRHTAASYHYALFENKTRTMEFLGNWEKAFNKHYMNRADVTNVEEFWTMLPTELRRLGISAPLPDGAKIKKVWTPKLRAAVNQAIERARKAAAV